mmetsp:Transcript_526/g.719  ORF Transcript_526/g.719 Transcript_526/m.719 type:complete len:115 (-) Transcript_526:108-452(-)
MSGERTRPPFPQKRVQKELDSLNARAGEDGIRVYDYPDAESCRIQVLGAPETLYAGENFMLRFRFPARYPFESPEAHLPFDTLRRMESSFDSPRGLYEHCFNAQQRAGESATQG